MNKKASKRFKKLISSSKDKKTIAIDEAIKKIKVNCTTKFDESIDVSFKLNLKEKKDEATLRTIAKLPNGNGKKLKWPYFAKKPRAMKRKIVEQIYLDLKI